MSQDYASYRQALGLNFGSAGDKISALKDRIYSEKIAPFTSGNFMNDLGLTQQIQSISDLKSSIEGIGGTTSGLLETAGSILGMRKLTSIVKGQKEKATSDTADKENVSEDTEPVPQEESQGSSLEDLFGENFNKVRNVISGENTAPSSGSTDLAPTEVNIPSTELGSGTLTTKEPSGSGEGDIEMTNFGETATEDASEIGGEIATETAEIGTEVGAIEGIGLGLDSIPIVGEVLGAVVGIGGAIFSAVESAKENTLQNAQTQADSALQSAKSAISNSVSKLQFSGASVIPSLSSTGSMPISAGTF